MAGINPLYIPEIVEQVFIYLSKDDLEKNAQFVCSLWQSSALREIETRKCLFAALRWLNPLAEKHKWYKKLGNSAFSHHVQSGALEKIREWIAINDDSNNNFNKRPMKRLKHNKSTVEERDEEMLILFSTGVSYVNSIIGQGYSYVLDLELFAAAKINWMLRGSMLFLTALKLMSCESCSPGQKFNSAWKKIEDSCDVIALKVPKMPNMHCFQYTTLEMDAEPDQVKWKSRKYQIDMFKKITKIDPDQVKIRAMVVINLKWYYLPFFKRVWQDYGPFPMIGCENEGLNWLIGKEDFMVGIEDYLSSISGFIIVEHPYQTIRTASVVLGLEDDIQGKVDSLRKLGFHPETTWGMALTGSLRGYAGDDFANEHVPERDELQRRECRLFHSIVGHNYVGAQVEYTYGTDHHMNCQTSSQKRKRNDEMGLCAQEIQFDDTSTVFLVVGK